MKANRRGGRRGLKIAKSADACCLPSRPEALRNLELGCALSMLISGTFFDLYAETDEATRIAVVHALNDKTSADIGLVREALRADVLAPLPGKDDAALGAEVVRLAFGGDMPSVASNSGPRSLLDQLAKELQGKVAKASFADQLNEPDSKWLAWDLLWAFRLQALCRLSLYLPPSRAFQPEVAHRQFAVFEAAISNELSELQRHAMNSSFPTTSAGPQRNAYVLLETREHVADGGRRILDMLSHRLEGTE